MIMSLVVYSVSEVKHTTNHNIMMHTVASCLKTFWGSTRNFGGPMPPGPIKHDTPGCTYHLYNAVGMSDIN